VAPYAANSKLFVRAGLVMIGLAWTLPFLQPLYRPPLQSFYAEWLAMVLGLGALVALLRREAWDGLPVPVMSLAALLLIVFLWLQYALGLMGYIAQALTPSLYLLWAALLVVAGNFLRRELGMERVATMLAWFLLAGGVLSAVAGVLQHYHVTPLVGTLILPKVTLQVYGNLTQPNHYAAYTSLALVALAYLFVRGRLPAAVAVPAAVVLAYAAAISGSRSVWFYLAALPIIALILHWREPRPEHRRLALVCAAYLPLFAIMNALAVLPWFAPAEREMMTALDRLFGSVSGVSVRLALWEEAWWMFTRAPLLGVGFGQFTWHHFEYGAQFGAPEVGLTNNAHNIVLQLLAETGLPGAALVVGAGIYWLAGLRGLRPSLELWWVLGLLAVIGLHSLLEYPLWYTYFLGMAAVTLGMGATQSVPVYLRRMGAPLVALVMLTGVVHAALLLHDFRRMERLIFSVYSTDADLPDVAVFRDVLTELHREPVLAPYVEVAITFAITRTEEQLPEKIAHVSRVMHYLPAPLFVYRLALLLALAGERAAALAQMEKALRVYPGSAKEVIPQLEELARLHPGRFEPLLESATRVARAPVEKP
jgi:O-antigen ligase